LNINPKSAKPIAQEREGETERIRQEYEMPNI